MEIPKKQSGRPAKYDLADNEESKFFPCAAHRRERIRAAALRRARATGNRITTRACKGGVVVYRLEDQN